MFEQADSNKVYECTGTVETVVYRNEDNGYTVIELSGDEGITAVGIMPDVSVGEEVKLTGVFKNHPSYGLQFSVTACERSIPTSMGGILKYLSSKAWDRQPHKSLLKNLKSRLWRFLKTSPKG